MTRQIGNATEDIAGTWRRRLLWTLAIVGGVLGFAWVISATVDLTIYGAYNHFIDALSGRLGINIYLANALSLVFIVPFFVGVKYYLFSVRDRRRKQKIGMAMLLTMGVIYNLGLYVGTRDEYFSPGSTKFYALVPGGVVFSDRGGIEPKYGVPFRNVTPENIRRLLRIQEGRVATVSNPAHNDWFDRVTGDPLLWYSRDAGGAFHFFDGPGHDPATSAELKPVTPEVRLEWEHSGTRVTVAPPSGASPTQWSGTVGTSPATLELDPQNTPGESLGRISYEDIVEDVVVTTDRGAVLLKGTSYHSSSGNNSFALDTFSGQLSADAQRMQGTFLDAAGRTGQWNFTRVGGTAGSSEGSATTRVQQPTIDLSRLEMRAIDPHTCEKPDDTYYGRWGPERAAPAGSGQLTNPEFLFDTRHEEDETTINWANGFRGTVPVCFVVDDKGNPSDIRFLQSPGGALEERVKAKINGWRYRPGTITQSFRDVPHPIPVQIGFEFVFK